MTSRQLSEDDIVGTGLGGSGGGGGGGGGGAGGGGGGVGLGRDDGGRVKTTRSARQSLRRTEAASMMVQTRQQSVLVLRDENKKKATKGGDF